MARTITLDSYDRNTGNVSFTIAGSQVTALNRSYTVNGVPMDSKDAAIAFIKQYLTAYAQGLQQKAPVAGSDITLGQAVDGE